MATFAIAGIRFPALQAASLLPSSAAYMRSVHHGERSRASLSSSRALRRGSSPRWKLLAGNPSYDTDSASTILTSENVLVSDVRDGGSSISTTSAEDGDVASDDLQVFQDGVQTEDKAEAEQESVTSELIDLENADQEEDQADESDEILETKPRVVPPPGSGQRIYEIDPMLEGHRAHLDYRYSQYKKIREQIDAYEGGLDAFSRGYEKFGFVKSETGITYREWAPGAKWAALIGDFNNWNPNADVMTKNEFGVWEIFLPNNADGSPPIPHGSRVKV